MTVQRVSMPVDGLPSSIGLSHGSGGRDMQALLDKLILPTLGLTEVNDQARVDLQELNALGDRLALTTDSYTVDPLFFPGGDIGSLAVNGTVNDLAVGGARPLYLSCGLIIEEGFDVALLRRVLTSMRAAADAVGLRIITGDTKVVHRGAADKLFINTTGVGVIAAGVELAPASIQVGDAVLISGPVGDHGAAILGARGELHLDVKVDSDCRPLDRLCAELVAGCPGLRTMRDATRGGVAAVLNEFAQAASVGIQIDEASVPVRAPVRGACEILGLDPMYLANEGTLIAIVPAKAVDSALQILNRYCTGAACIGRCHNSHPGMVSLVTSLGGERVMDMPAGELLPRIC